MAHGGICPSWAFFLSLLFWRTIVENPNDFREIDRAKQHGLRPGEICIEIDGETDTFYERAAVESLDDINRGINKVAVTKITSGNTNQLFFPLERVVRSRIVFARFGRKYRLDDATQMLDHVPGERLHIDLDRRIGRCTDGLLDPENESINQQCRAAAREMQMPFFLGYGKAEEIQLTTDTAYWNWIFWMRRIIDQGCAKEGPRACRPVQNVDLLPSYEQCVRSLKVDLHYNTEDDQIAVYAIEAKRKESEPGYKDSPELRGKLTPHLAGLKD